jgi:GDP-mannose 6-dehydrogenase
MKISIFGVGYVGCVSGACLAEMGNEIVAVEPNETKVRMVNEGQSPIVEPGLNELLARMVKTGRLTATADWAKAVQSTELAMICVGTPSRPNGSIDLKYVLRVCEQVGQALAAKKEFFTVVIRSTVVPGTVESVVIPLLEKHSGKRAGVDFGVCMNPEFLREGTSIADFYNPPKTVIGELNAASGEGLARLYQKLSAPLIRTAIPVAELVKYADNSFHALKICFANEIGNICKLAGVDSHKVMEIFCMDTKLNISKAYLKPGFAFGGSCLPKDLRSLTYVAKANDVSVPMLSSLLESNQQQIRRVIQKLLARKGQSLGFVGLSFKEGTDDLRESPIVEVIETMIGKGFKVRIYDRNVSLARLMGANKEYIEKEIPHVSDLLCGSLDDLIAQSDVLIVTNKDPEYAAPLKRVAGKKMILDLVRIFNADDQPSSEYEGICW